MFVLKEFAVGLGRGAVEELFAAVHSIRADKRAAFRSRLKHLQRLSFPPGVNTGTGRAADYGGQQIYLLGLALEMLQLGLSPERAVRVILENLEAIAPATRLALYGLNHPTDTPLSMFLRFDPSALGDLSDGDQDDASATLWYGGQGVIKDLIDEMSTLWPRLALINVSSIVSHVFSQLHESSASVADAFEHELTAWLEQYPEDSTDGDT